MKINIAKHNVQKFEGVKTVTIRIVTIINQIQIECIFLANFLTSAIKLYSVK